MTKIEERCGHLLQGKFLCGCLRGSPNHAIGGFQTHPFSPGRPDQTDLEECDRCGHVIADHRHEDGSARHG